MSTNRYAAERRADEYVAGIDTDANGQVSVTLTDLKQLESAADVSAHATGGYVVTPVSVSDNVVTLEVRASAGTAGDPLPLVTGGAGVTDVRVSAVGY